MGDPEVDPGHLLPAEAWQAVVDAAELEAQRIAAGHPAPEAPVEHGFATGALPLSGVVNAPGNGGRRAGGAPTFGVLHTAETPLRAGYAASIARYFASGPGTSCHYMTDPAETWGVLDDALVAWHCGTGNTNSLGLEQSGRASMPRAEWLSADGYAQMRRNAAIMRAARDRYGIALRWMTDAELLAAHRRQIVGGWTTHDQCRRVLGGTTHTDPTPGFPLDVQMTLATGEATPTGDDDMNAEQDRKLAEVYRMLALLLNVELSPKSPAELPIGQQVTGATVGGAVTDLTGSPQGLGPVLAEMFANSRAHSAALAALLARPAGVDVDEAELSRLVTAALAPAVIAALGAERGISAAEVEAAVRRVFADGGQA